MRPTCILIGSHPKGYDEPFHPHTHSGRVLRKILGDKIEDVRFFDLWKDEEETKAGTISEPTITQLLNFHKNGCAIVALGKTVEKAMAKAEVSYISAPHPSSRRKTDRQTLQTLLHDILMNNS